ncbi:MAG: DNA-3-methyladenine glycosylase [Bacteroidales bacterium]|nr:DNA-3-methyladenine glycosylase [Bacteroidales bacterium]
MKRLDTDFFIRDVLEVAPDLLGKQIHLHNGENHRIFRINEVEAYRGMEDLACHASKGKTNRTEIMFHRGGYIYVYLIYGMYWMLNFVSGPDNIPQAVLIRGVEEFNGPGKLTRAMGIDKSYYGEDLTTSERIWVSDAKPVKKYNMGSRIGVDYAGEIWKNKPWRYYY